MEIENPPVALDDAAVTTLDAHAHLSVLTDNPVQRAILIRQGYSDLATIASTPRAEYVQKVQDDTDLDEQRAIHLHQRAQTQVQFLNTVLLGLPQRESMNREYSCLDNDKTHRR